MNLVETLNLLENAEIKSPYPEAYDRRNQRTTMSSINSNELPNVDYKHVPVVEVRC